MSQEIYKNLIFTKHALQRMSERSITQDAVFRVVQAPDKQFGTEQSKSVKFIRTLASRKYHIVGQWKKQESKWLIISVWVRGEDDREALTTQLLLLPFRIIWWILKKLFGKN